MKLISCKRDLTHIISQAVWAIALYSTSALDRITTFCFLLRHLTKRTITGSRSSIIMVSSPISIRKSFHIKAIRRPIRPIPGPFFRYLNILYTAFQCGCLGACINWLNNSNSKSNIWSCHSKRNQFPNKSPISSWSTTQISLFSFKLDIRVHRSLSRSRTQHTTCRK